MTPDEIVAEWRKGCTHYGPKAVNVVEDPDNSYVGGCEECTDAMVKVLLRQITDIKHAILFYREKPGCNPASRKLAMRRLLWAAGEDL